MKLRARQKTVYTGQYTAGMSVPYSHVAMLTKMAEARSLNIKPALSKFDIHTDQFDVPHARILDKTYTELLLYTDTQASEPSFWLDFGQQYTFATLGELGLLLVTCSNGYEALPLFCRYYGTISCGTILEYETEENAIHLIKNSAPNSRASIIKTELLASAICKNAGFLLQMEKPTLSYEFDYEAPDDLSLYHRYLGQQLSFGHGKCRIVFQRNHLKQPFPQANTIINTQAINSCESMLDQLNMHASLEAKVKSIILMTPGLEPTKDQVATALGFSSRTFTRRLSEQGLRFDEIRRSVQYERARDLLCATTLTINEIAPLVGFDNGSNFTRAFTKWSGKTPTEFRSEPDI